MDTLEAASDDEIDAYAPDLVQLLTKRTDRTAREARRVVARVFARLPRHARSAAVSVAGEHLLAAAATSDDPDPLARRSAAVLAGLAPATHDLCRRLPIILADTDPGVVEAAEQALTELAARAGRSSPEDRTAIERIVIDAMAGFDQHRRRAVLLAGIQLLGTPAALAAAASVGADWLADASHPAQLAIRSLIRRGSGPALTRAALVWLRLPAQAPACRDRLLRAGAVEEHEAVLSSAHLLAHPERRRALRQRPLSDQDGTWKLDARTVARLPLEARRHVPRLLGALPLDAASSSEAVLASYADESPLVRLAGLTAPGVPPAMDAITDLAYDDDASVARSAALRLVHARPASPRAQGSTLVQKTIDRLARSPHAQVRSVCAGAGADPHSPRARLAWRLSLRRDRAAALAELRDAILMGDTRDRIDWIATCRRLGAASALERELCDIVEDSLSPAPDGDPAPALALAATAAAALAECAADRSERVLEAALGSSDPRVVANAVEAMARRRRREGESAAADRLLSVIVELKESPAHRVRASAALAMLQEAAPAGVHRLGEDVLRDMLADERPMHRLAGVWLADRAASSGAISPGVLVEPIQLLRHDADTAVRERAKRTRRLLGVLAGAREVCA